MMRRIRLSGNRPNGLIERILVPFRQPRAAAIAVVRLQQLRPVADVEPLAGEAIAVDGRPRVEPGDEVAGLIGRIPLGEVGAQQREVRTVVQVRGDRNQVRRGTLGLLLEADDAVVRIELDDAVLTHALPSLLRQKSTYAARLKSKRLSPAITRSSSPSHSSRSATNAMSPMAPSRSSFEVVPSSWMRTRARPRAQPSKSGAKRAFVT